MRAAVTEGVGAMAVLRAARAAGPGPGEVRAAPEAVGICGSDYHFFAGELSEAAGGSQFPRVQGHEVAGTITALGAGLPRRARGRPAGGAVAAARLRALLSVQRRASQHL